MDYKSIESVCFVFLHGIGDFVMFTPALKKIKVINPDIKITVVLRKELGLRPLAENQGYIDRVLEMPLRKQPRFYVPWIFWTKEYWIIKKRLARLLKDEKLLKGERFDRAQVIYHQVFPTFLYLLFCPKRARAHKIESLAREAGVILGARELDTPVLQIPDDEVRKAGRALRALVPTALASGTLLIGIQRNTMDRTRFIPLSAVQGFIDGLNANGGPKNPKSDKNPKFLFLVFADEAAFKLEQEVDGGHLEAANLFYSSRVEGGHDALGLAALVQNCDFIVSVDSAVFNIASALGKPVLGVFNNYKVRSGQRALTGGNVLCIDSPRIKTRAEDLLLKFHALLENEKAPSLRDERNGQPG